MMTNKEIDNLIQNLLTQVNQAFEQDRKRIDVLEEKVKALTPKAPRKTTAKKAA